MVICRVKSYRIWVLSFVLVLLMTSFASASERSGSFGDYSSGSFGGGPNSNWSLVSYDALSQLCVDINEDPSWFSSPFVATLSLVGDIWVICVSDNGTDYWYCNDAGYPYYAEVDITGEDSVDLLSKILTRLILVEHYVKSTFFELWEQGNVLDDIYFKLDSFFTKVYDKISFIRADTSEILTVVSSIKDRLYYNGKSVANYLSSIDTYFSTSNGLAKNTNTILNNILFELENLNSGPVEGGTSSDLSTVEGLVGQIQIAASASNLKLEQVNQYLYSLDTKLDMSTVIEKQNAIISHLFALSGDLDTVLTNQTSANEVLESISASLTNNDSSVAQLLALINTNFRARLTIVADNQAAANERLAQLHTDFDALLDTQEVTASVLVDLLDAQQDVASDLASFLVTWDAVQSALNELVSLQSSAIISLSNIEAALINNNVSISKTLTYLNNNFLSKSATLIENQESILALMQAEGAFTTDISGVLGFLTEMEDDTMHIRHYLSDWSLDFDLGLTAVTNMNSKMTSVLKNLESIISLMQDGSSVSSDLSGVEDKLDKLIELLEGMNNPSSENIENDPVDSTHEAYEVFVITDADGNEIKLSGLSGDALVIGGRLMNFLYKVAFDGALEDVDAAIEDMTDFYISDSVVLSEGGSLWD